VTTADTPNRVSRWRRLSPADLVAAVQGHGNTRLRRSLGRLELTAMGIGTVVGAGIFVTTGVAAANQAGPAITVSFLLAGLVCVLVALCYGELAAMVPVAGSAYTYTYATLGEVAAFVVGWTLILELVVATAAVAIGWAGTLTAVLAPASGPPLPAALTAAPAEGGVVNLPAMLVILAVVGVLIGRVTLTARVNAALVAITIGVLVLIVAVGTPHVSTVHWEPFAPFGAAGVVAGAALAFFAFLGFDVVATSAEESRDPQRDMPFAIIGTVIVATVLYVAVSAVLTGVSPYPTLDNEAPIANAFQALDLGWVGALVLIGSLIALTKGLLMLCYGQTRLVFAMCRDRLLPAGLARTSPKNGVPVRLTLLLGGMGALIAGFTPIGVVAELVNIGALFAFAVVCLGVLILRVLEPHRRRPFRAPLVPLVPLLALGGCLVLASTLAGLTWLRFVLWLAVGVVVYLLYGRRNSRFARPADARTPEPG
jgi:basic amino acid/polyamine antiporter, APA family